MPFHVAVLDKICIRFSLLAKNPVKIVQKKYITVVILWQPQNTQKKIKKLLQDLKAPLFRTILYISGLNFSWEQVLKLT